MECRSLRTEQGQSSWLPIIEFCGAGNGQSGLFMSGLLRQLASEGLRLALVCRDEPDSHVLAGATGSTVVYRSALDVTDAEDLNFLEDLVAGHDLVLLVGDYHSGAAQFLLQRSVGDQVGESGADVIHVFRPNDDPHLAIQAVLTWLAQLCLATPVWACVLIGGRSSRMGSPKHLLAKNKTTWLEETVALLRPLTDGIILSGAGEVPPSLADLPRLVDAPGIQGPLAGILAAMRWRPRFSWLLLACDMPVISSPALEWLLARRRPGSWGTVPRLEHDGFVEPLLAHYDFRAIRYFEDLAASDCLKIGQVARRSKIETPVIPYTLRDSWLNINTPAELKAARTLF